jgi:hypothetical protein
MILMLEDNAERIEQFKAVLRLIGPSLELKVWRDAHRMIDEVAPWLPQAKLISLDHDLEPEIGDPDPGDGVMVAKFLVSQPIVRPVVIHSSNSERARWMEGDFELAGWRTWRAVPLGDDWIECHWRQVVREILRSKDGRPH